VRGPPVLGTLGKVGNCQVAVSVHAACDAASAPLDWRLYVPERWDQRCAGDPAGAAAAGRKRCAIPDSEHHRPKWQMALEVIDESIEWRRTPPDVMVAIAVSSCGASGRSTTTAVTASPHFSSVSRSR
jgi:hypothetical protein